MPFSVKYDPAQELLVTFEVPNGDSTSLITIYLPKGAIKESAMLEVEIGDESSNFGLGDFNLLISLTSIKDGSNISVLTKPMEIRPWFDVRAPRLNEPGTCSQPFTLLRTDYLPKVQRAGFFINPSGLLTLYTRALSKITNTNLTAGEQICLIERTGFIFETREFNRVIASNLKTSPYLVVDLKEKFAGKEIEVQLRRSINRDVRITRIAKVRVNAKGDSIVPFGQELLKSDRFRVRIDRFPLAVRTVTLMNP